MLCNAVKTPIVVVLQSDSMCCVLFYFYQEVMALIKWYKSVWLGIMVVLLFSFFIGTVLKTHWYYEISFVLENMPLKLFLDHNDQQSIDFFCSDYSTHMGGKKLKTHQALS